jgi:HAE1 family hydrophobic/amphiphilic exporter-1
MNIASVFIRRPVMTTLVMSSIMLFGIMAYKMLPVSDLPNVDFPTISVYCSYPGASPATMASSVAMPLEKELSTIAGVDSMSSTSSIGSTSITIQFALARNIDAAAQDVQAAIARAMRKLPADLPAPPSYRKTNPADQPILYLAMTSNTLAMSDVDEYAETMLAQQMSMINGVSEVRVFGSQKYAVRIQLDPKALASRGIGLDEMNAAVTSQNVNVPLGGMAGPYQSVTLQANGQLVRAKDYLRLVLAYRNGQPVRLNEVGTAIDSVENDKSLAWYMSDRARSRSIVLAVLRQPGTNTLQVADSVKSLLNKFRTQLPASVSLSVLRDGSVPIRESAHDVQFTLLITLALVVLVIFLFLRNLSATVIPSLTLPMAIVGTFMVMYLLSYSLDNLSLMALTLSVGFIVDDAVVMLENIVRHMEMGKTRMQAALEGAQEIGFTIVSMTISLAAVFIPVLFMGGLVGRLFREFAVTIGAAVLVSGVVSLTLTPMLASRFLREHGPAHHNAAYRATEAAFNWMVKIYSSTLWVVLRHRRTTMIFSAAILVATGLLFKLIPMDFIPAEDRDQFVVQVEAPQQTSFDAMAAYQRKVMDCLQADENVDRFMSSVGGSSFGQANTGMCFVVLKPRRQRQLKIDQVIAELRAKLTPIPGIRVYLTNPLPINVGGRMTRALYQVTFLGSNTQELYAYGEKMEEQIRQLPGLMDVSSDLQMKNPQVNVLMDRDKAKAYDVTPFQITDAIDTAFGTRQISTILTPTNDYQVIMEVMPEYQLDKTSLSMLYIRSAQGQLVPLKAVTSLTENLGPLSIAHSGQMPSVTVSFNLKPGVALSDATKAVDAIAATSLPAGMSYAFQGTAQAFKDSMNGMVVLLILAVVVIYVVLGVLYESFYHPITILSALPFAGFGALLTLMIFKATLSLYAFVGIIMLIGLVKKNGIMMVDFAIECQHRDGLGPVEAIHKACMVRFRPIMMTTMAALMAGIPIAMGYGAGGEARRPLGLSVTGGLMFSQSLTLYVTPVFFVYMEKIRHLLSRHGRKGHVESAAQRLAQPAVETVEP